MAIYRRTQDYESNKALLILSVVVVIAGILILLSSFMTWTAGQTGWSMKGSFNQGDRSYSSNPFYIYWGDVYLLFSGLCSLILGILIGLAGLVMLASYSRLLSGLAVFASFVASVMAIFNTVTIVRLHSGMGPGMFVFLIASLFALVASAMTQSSSFLVARDTEVA